MLDNDKNRARLFIVDWPRVFHISMFLRYRHMYDKVLSRGCVCYPFCFRFHHHLVDVIAKQLISLSNPMKYERNNNTVFNWLPIKLPHCSYRQSVRHAICLVETLPNYCVVNHITLLGIPLSKSHEPRSFVLLSLIQVGDGWQPPLPTEKSSVDLIQIPFPFCLIQHITPFDRFKRLSKVSIIYYLTGVMNPTESRRFWQDASEYVFFRCRSSGAERNNSKMNTNDSAKTKYTRRQNGMETERNAKEKSHKWDKDFKATF